MAHRLGLAIPRGVPHVLQPTHIAKIRGCVVDATAVNVVNLSFGVAAMKDRVHHSMRRQRKFLPGHSDADPSVAIEWVRVQIRSLARLLAAETRKTPVCGEVASRPLAPVKVASRFVKDEAFAQVVDRNAVLHASAPRRAHRHERIETVSVAGPGHAGAIPNRPGLRKPVAVPLALLALAAPDRLLGGGRARQLGAAAGRELGHAAPCCSGSVALAGFSTRHFSACRSISSTPTAPPVSAAIRSMRAIGTPVSRQSETAALEQPS